VRYEPNFDAHGVSFGGHVTEYILYQHTSSALILSCVETSILCVDGNLGFVRSVFFCLSFLNRDNKKSDCFGYMNLSPNI
jgi:hypothetical protein